MDGWPGYEGLADAHYGRLRRLGELLLGDRHEAEEVVQDVFMKAWVVANGASEPIESLPLRVQEPSPADLALSEETQRRIWRAFRALPARQREVVVLRYVEELPTAGVAATLGVSEGSVKRHLFRAIRRLRAALGGRP